MKQIFASLVMLVCLVCLPIIGAAQMAQTPLIVQAQLSPGTIQSPAIDLPQGIIISDLQIVSSDWPDPQLHWSIDVERSFDGGQTWQYWFGGNGTGEQSYDKQGQPVMPRLGVNLNGDEPPMKLRATVGLNKKIRIGLKGLTQ